MAYGKAKAMLSKQMDSIMGKGMMSPTAKPPMSAVKKARKGKMAKKKK